ncbi:MAG: TrkH family potassium uptake protein [Lachnospiraceae bacterium]|nr:TrkH family potassium uptake protein [Lachnospiraceae bacterium]
MNKSIVRYVLGSVLKLEGILLLLPALTGLIYLEIEGLVYLMVGALATLLGFLLTIHRPKDTVFYLKEGCVTTALSWILLSLVGCLPFVLTGEIPHFINALFETISGFTTTGASILNTVETLSHPSLIWRSFTHWIGGMGVLVFILAIIPLSGGSNINLMRAESPGPSVGKLVPRMKETARNLYIIYFALTLLEFIFLICGHMPVFDAICTSFGTAGTGGFGIKDTSIGGYSIYLQWVVTVFMILFGVNFNAYYFIIAKQFKKAWEMEEVKEYFVIIAIAIGLITFNILSLCENAFDAITKASFQVASIITTTGFSTANFDTWPGLSKTILVLLMFVGACAGSTGGGIKVSRIVIGFKSFVRESFYYIHPKSVRKVKVDGKPVDSGMIHSVNIYFMTFIWIFVISIIIISIDGMDLVTNFTAVAATINNIGPGLEQVGPIQNFSRFSDLSKCVLMFDMLAGRLELYPLLLLLHPLMWKDVIDHRRHRFSTWRRNRIMERQKKRNS